MQAEEYLETLEPLSQKLQEQFPAAKFDRKSLGQLVGQIRQLQEDALGVKVCVLSKPDLCFCCVSFGLHFPQRHGSCPALQSLPPRPFPKIPSKLFQDLSLKGSLWLIVSKCHEAMGARALKRVDFTNPLHRSQASALTQRRQEAVGVSRLASAACQCSTRLLTDSLVLCCLQFKDILAQVMHELIKQGFLKWPRVYVHPSCGPEVPLLQKLVIDLRGEVATSAGDCLYFHYLSSTALMSPDIQENAAS